MNQKNFINYHIMISHSPSCLNRDDMNMQKTAVFGGVRRVRISSQSLKRAMRESVYYLANLGKPSTRTRELGLIKAKFTSALKDRYDEALTTKAIEWISGREGLAEDTQADAVAPWAVEEIARFCEWIKSDQSLDADKLKKQIEKDAKPVREALAQTVDIALSGRMATSGLMTSVDGALAVAHVITTHAVDGDIDWFTAVDDLVADAGEVGAGHLNTQEFSAGVFYRYASLNIRQLQENLGGASRERVLEIAKHVLHLLATVVPSAKQQTFAAHNPADFALVSFADQPISLANAFEAPIKNGRNSGFLQPSMERLAEYWETINRKYSLNEQAAAFSLGDIALPDILKLCATLPDLETWIETGGHA
jgi:CRISPR system Cascade subunit CasC